jgi:hypothetical protein
MGKSDNDCEKINNRSGAFYQKSNTINCMNHLKNKLVSIIRSRYEYRHLLQFRSIKLRKIIYFNN